MREAIALIQLADPSYTIKLKALDELRELHSSHSYDLIKTAQAKAVANAKPEVAAARSQKAAHSQ